MTTEDINWPEALRATDNDQQATSVNALRALLLNGLRVALAGHADMSEAQLEDFAQEALLRVMNRLDQFQGRSRFTTWAQSIALNTAFSELRSKRWRDVSLDALLATGDRLADPSALPDDLLGAHEDRRRLVSALRQAIAEKLTPKQRAAMLAELDGLPVDQVTALLGINRNAAYKMYHDARQSLKKHLLEAGITGRDIQEAFEA